MPDHASRHCQAWNQFCCQDRSILLKLLLDLLPSTLAFATLAQPAFEEHSVVEELHFAHVQPTPLNVRTSMWVSPCYGQIEQFTLGYTGQSTLSSASVFLSIRMPYRRRRPHIIGEVPVTYSTKIVLFYETIILHAVRHDSRKVTLQELLVFF